MIAADIFSRLASFYCNFMLIIALYFDWDFQGGGLLHLCNVEKLTILEFDIILCVILLKSPMQTRYGIVTNSSERPNKTSRCVFRVQMTEDIQTGKPPDAVYHLGMMQLECNHSFKTPAVGLFNYAQARNVRWWPECTCKSSIRINEVDSFTDRLYWRNEKWGTHFIWYFESY